VKNQNFKINNWIDKIELGSAQFGLDYGVNNGKKISQNQAYSIHELLCNNNACLIDTAPSYGNSETIVSSIIKEESKIITKLLPLSQYSIEEIMQGIEVSKILFGRHLSGFMIHNANDVFDDRFTGIIDYLSDIKHSNIKIGVSVYDPLEVFEISNKLTLDMIQIPFNILDQRANNTYFLDYVKKQNIEVHVRSVFLQGLLLMDENTPHALNAVLPYRNLVNQAALSQGLSMYELCLFFVFKQSWINKVVIGLDNKKQANSLINTVKKLSNIDNEYDFSIFACNDINIINPAKWHYDH
jgi:aryl-alcohol dehydrogenase-like predicted oxidoreductase